MFNIGEMTNARWKALKNAKIVPIKSAETLRAERIKKLNGALFKRSRFLKDSPLTNEIIHRCLHEEGELVDCFKRYYDNNIIAQALEIPMPFVSRWLRSYLFSPQLLNRTDKEFFSRIKLNEIHQAFFYYDLTFSQLRRFEAYFGLREIISQDIILQNHSEAVMSIVKSYADPVENLRDFAEFLKKDRHTLEDFFNSEFYQTLSQWKVTLSFLNWALENFSNLKDIISADNVFFQTTMNQLFSTPLKISIKKPKPFKEGQFFPASTLKLTCFQLLNKATAATASKCLYSMRISSIYTLLYCRQFCNETLCKYS